MSDVNSSVPSSPSTPLEPPSRQPRYVSHVYCGTTVYLTCISTDKGIVSWHGRHFMRAVYAFPDVKQLLDSGAEVYKKVDEDGVAVETLTVRFVCMPPFFTYLTCCNLGNA